MPLFSILFFILSLGNYRVPLTLNFIREFMSLYSVFKRLPLLSVFTNLSIVFSAVYTIYMFNRITFRGLFSKFFKANISDINKREFFILLTLIAFTIILGIYPAPIINSLYYLVLSLIYNNYT
jgi:NADH-ubiquinone oxidoreductase chain 4